MKLVDKGPRFSFVDWDGWEYPLATDEKVDAFLNLIVDKNATNKEETAFWFLLPQGVWSDNVLKFSTRRGTVVFDLKDRHIAVEPLDSDQEQEFNRIAAADAADTPWTTIQVAPYHGGQYALHCRMRTGGTEASARIELVDNKMGRRRILLEGLLPVNFLVHHLFPSPDGQLILACLIEASSNAAQIHVVQPDGKVLAKVDAGTGELKGPSR
jgi:hypothetical protein